ncbi:dynein regulatory complex subunit 6 [Synchiropus splendidus]|uniref:dynein regulatory complex subunit 6 n=1 Tax=Synchiropus splendidus TaxID=270530 RepID=UPI00237DA2AD|nr:dynein regulatory complex subunit 6 [Synchiropus splendidus]
MVKKQQPIFRCLCFDDWLACAEVCCSWQCVVQASSLWSQIDFSTSREQVSDRTVKWVLQTYALFVVHLSVRGCTSLSMDSLNFISYCRNLQELNMSGCSHATDFMIRKIIKGCPWLLYLNISGTSVTNKTIQELSRTCLNLLYLSLACCCTFSDEAFIYLNTEKGFPNLIHLNLSGCIQMTVSGFKCVSARCPALKEIVLDDMPTLSNSCIQALASTRRCLAAISLLGSSHLSDDGVIAVANASKLKRFTIQGNYQISDVGWKTLCVASPELCRLHAAECPRMTDASLKSVAALKNLQYLDVSYCHNLSDQGISHLADGSSASKLKELNVSHCGVITDEGVRRIAQRLVELRRLNLSYCDRLSDAALAGLSGSSLHSLDVSGCNIHDQGLAALEKIPIKTLILADCINITDDGIEVLCQHVRHLEHVDVSHCTSLSDTSVRALSFYCPGLVALRVSGCLKLTDMAVQYLTSGAQYVRELDVSGCVLLTSRSVRLLLKICPPLSSVTMTCCSGISGFSASQLKPHVQHWQHSSDDPTPSF